MIKYHVEVLWENGGIVPWIPKFGAGLLGVDECQFHAPTIPPPGPSPSGKWVRYTLQEHTAGLDALGMRNSPAGNPGHFLYHSVGNVFTTTATS